MLESLRIPDGEGMPSPYNATIRYAAKQSFTAFGGRFVNCPYGKAYNDVNTAGEKSPAAYVLN